MLYPQFIGGSYRSQSPHVSQERTVNFYPEVVEVPGGRVQVYLLPTPGVEVFVTLPTAPERGCFYQNNRAFVVSGDVFYEVFANRTYIARGTLGTTDGLPVTIASNGDGGGQIAVGASNQLWIYDVVTHAWTLARANATTMVVSLGGYFVALDAPTSTVFISDLFDGLVWNALQFIQRTNVSDRWRSIIVDNDQLVLFGESTSDRYYVANTRLPLQPMPGAVMQYGTVATFSPAQVPTGVIWLAQTVDGAGKVVMASGATPRVLSNKALDNALRGYVRLDDAIGETYEERGHTFYLLTLPTARATWALDLETGAWCERGTWVVEQAEYQYWRPTFHMYALNLHLMGDRETGVLYRMDADLPLDVDGRPIRRLRRAPALHHEADNVYYDYFELEFERGLGTVTGQGKDPQVELRVSKDGGKTWYSAGFRSLGKMGNYRQRAKWNRIGYSFDRVFETVFADPAPSRISNAFLGLRSMESRGMNA